QVPLDMRGHVQHGLVVAARHLVVLEDAILAAPPYLDVQHPGSSFKLGHRRSMCMCNAIHGAAGFDRSKTINYFGQTKFFLYRVDPWHPYASSAPRSRPPGWAASWRPAATSG